MSPWFIILVATGLFYGALTVTFRNRMIDHVIATYYKDGLFRSKPNSYGQYYFRFDTVYAGLNPIGLQYSLIPTVALILYAVAVENTMDLKEIPMIAHYGLLLMQFIFLLIGNITRYRLRGSLKPQFYGPGIFVQRAGSYHWLEALRATGKSDAMMFGVMAFETLLLWTTV